MRQIIFALGFLLSTSLAHAQTVPELVVSWDVEFWAQGVNPATGAPISAANFTKAGATCDLPTPPAPALPMVNPTMIFAADPDRPGRACQLGPLTSAGLLMSLPAQAGMFATGRARGSTLVSARSGPSNSFNHVLIVPPPVPSGLVIQ